MKYKKLIFFFVSVVLLVGVVSIYKFVHKNYYEVDTSPYKYIVSSTTVDSPDQKHNVYLIIYRTTQKSDTAYIMGYVQTYGEGKKNAKDYKTIFWQKIKSSNIKTITHHGVALDNWIDVTWIDNENVNINGISVNINRGYDYRRDWHIKLSRSFLLGTHAKRGSFYGSRP